MSIANSRDALNAALSHHDPSWAFFHCLTHDDLIIMDHLLVEQKHTLAYEAGTQLTRFRELHRTGYRFPEDAIPNKQDFSAAERETARRLRAGTPMPVPVMPTNRTNRKFR